MLCWMNQPKSYRYYMYLYGITTTSHHTIDHHVCAHDGMHPHHHHHVVNCLLTANLALLSFFIFQAINDIVNWHNLLQIVHVSLLLQPTPIYCISNRVSITQHKDCLHILDMEISSRLALFMVFMSGIGYSLQSLIVKLMSEHGMIYASDIRILYEDCTFVDSRVLTVASSYTYTRYCSCSLYVAQDFEPVFKWVSFILRFNIIMRISSDTFLIPLSVMSCS